jgi:hypothetical protein
MLKISSQNRSRISANFIKQSTCQLYQTVHLPTLSNSPPANFIKQSTAAQEVVIFLQL